jgi:hypothetical protein
MIRIGRAGQDPGVWARTARGAAAKAAVASRLRRCMVVFLTVVFLPARRPMRPVMAP